MSPSSYRPPGVSVTNGDSSIAASNQGAGDVLLFMGVCDQFPSEFTDVVRLYGGNSAELTRHGIDSGTIEVRFRDSSTNLILNTDYVIEQEVSGLGYTVSNISKKTASITNEAITFSSGAGQDQSLANANVIGETVVVTDTGATVTYEEGTDYVVNYLEGSVSRISGSTIGATDTVHVDYDYATIADGQEMLVTYEWQPDDLYQMKEWASIPEAMTFYGPAMINDSINSPISLALRLASNAMTGAQMPRVKTLAVNPNSGSVDDVDWLTALNDQVAGEYITHLVPLTASKTVWSHINNFIQNQATNDNGNGIRVALGGDSNTYLEESATGSTSIFGLDTSRVLLVSATSVPINNPDTNNIITVPGYYAAGIFSAVETTTPRSASMTYKILPGIEQFTGGSIMTETKKNTLAASGVTVLENYGLGVRVRHSKTTSLTTAAKEEPSIQRVLDYISIALKRRFANKFIGSNYFVELPTKIAIETEVEQAFNDFIASRDIAGYSNLSVSTGSDPRSFSVSINLVPLFPVNNIDFNINLTI